MECGVSGGKTTTKKGLLCSWYVSLVCITVCACRLGEFVALHELGFTGGE